MYAGGRPPEVVSYSSYVKRVACVKFCKLIMGSGEAIPAEPPSLVHKDLTSEVAERVWRQSPWWT